MKIKLIRKIKQRIRDISNVWSVAGIRNVYVMAITYSEAYPFTFRQLIRV